MEVLVGLGAAPAYVRDMGLGEAQDNDQGVTGAALSGRMIFQKKNGYQEDEDDDDVAESDRSSSSIGIPEDSEEEEEEEEEVSSKEGFGSIGSLEELLPIKRGLSNHFSGKSKSFTNLAEATATTASAKDLEKTEHPFNKKRRILRWSKNLMMLPTAVSMPLLSVSEEDESRCHRDIDDENDQERGSDTEKELPTPRSVFKSYSCFALTDLREEEEEED